MNKQQKAVHKAALTAEEAELKALKAIYRKASEEVAEKIAIHQGTINTLLRNYDKLSEAEKSILQSKIYQKQFQESLQKQLDGFLNDLDGKQFESISAYLEECYQNGYIGTMYDLAGQGIPITTPIDQQDVVKAANIDSKISTDLYTKLGEDVDLLKARIKASISVGIATASTYSQMATKIASDSNVGFNRAMRIARTEGHRVQIAAAMDAQHKAKSKGADVLKKWSSALDARTRPTHKILDGQIRELDEPFEVNGKQALAPGHFGIAGEDINCRCALVQTARWALDEEYLEEMQKRAEYFGLDKSDEFEDFKKKYLGIPSANGSNKSARNGKTIQFDWKGTDARHANQQQIIKSLSDEYNTRLQKVTIGARQAAGDVDITGSSKKESLEKVEKRGTITNIKQLNSKVSNGTTVVNPMNKAKYESMKAKLEKNGIHVIQAVDDDLKYLQSLGAEASYGNGYIMHIGEVPSASGLFEEIIHSTQAKKYGEFVDSDPLELYAREVAANRMLLKNGKAYGFDETDFADIKQNLAGWEEKFRKFTGVSYDESDYSREI